MQQIRLKGLQTSDQVEALYWQLYGLRDNACDELELDLSCVSFLRPDKVVTLLTAARLWHRWTQNRLILTNIQSELHRYLERIDLFTVCSAWLTTPQTLDEDDRYSRSSASRTLLEVMSIASKTPQLNDDVHRAYERADAILRCWFPERNSATERLCKMLIEIAENVEHSEDQGFVLMQRYDGRIRPRLGSEVVIAVGDLGIGIPQSLARKGVHPSQKTHQASHGASYILHALQQGVSSRGEPAGMGLWRVQKIVADWCGELVIRSNGSAIRITNGIVTTEDNLSPIPGTQVIITVREA